MKELTLKQRSILEFITTCIQKLGYPPTVREIGEHFGFLWAAARGHLKTLEKKGFIKIAPYRSRGIEVVGLRSPEGVMIPVAGRIRAGKPILAAEDIDEHILIDKNLFPSSDTFSLKVTGDSMIDAGIFEGDYVIIRPQKTIESGEIGVVLIEDEATIKRIVIKSRKVILKPENKNMEPISYEPEDLKMIGKVIGVIRKI
ncbi:MAG: repressor LexA [Nitrospirae bacterium GWC2_42_7]|nr:MAG: repressor LexA [Nitrospirae bacterium GWC2_42_7]